MSIILVFEGTRRQLNPSSASSENIAKVFKLASSSVILTDALTDMVHLPQNNHFDPVLEAGKTYKVEGDKVSVTKAETPEKSHVVQEVTEANNAAANNQGAAYNWLDIAHQVGQFVQTFMAQPANPHPPSPFRNREFGNRPYRNRYQDDDDDDDDSDPDEFEYEDNEPWENDRRRY